MQIRAAARLALLGFAMSPSIDCGTQKVITSSGSAPSNCMTPSLATPCTDRAADVNAIYNYAPSSRTIEPRSIYKSAAAVQNPSYLLMRSPTRLLGRSSYVTLDFGKEIGGIVTLSFADASDGKQTIGMAFAESSLYVGPASDASNGGTGSDGALYFSVTAYSSYTMPTDKLRGGFRYLTIFLDSGGWVDITGASVQVTASPLMGNLQRYIGYFYCNDDLLNRIWYAGAYTVQMDTIGSAQGRLWPPVVFGWENNGMVGVGESTLVDGAKRDRTVWPGDLVFSQLTAFVSTGDTVSTRNALTTLYEHQQSDGALPYAGPLVSFYGTSDTYHLWTLLDTAEYWLDSGDKPWLDAHWGQYKAGLQYSLRKIDTNGIFNADQGTDWGRNSQTTGEVIEANAILYRVLLTGADLARVEHDDAVAIAYNTSAQKLKQSVNSLLWDPAAGRYRNDPTSTLYPQDGNSLAVWYGLGDSPAMANSVSQTLQRNWNGFGAQTPERTGAIATFPGSMEVNAHFAAGDDEAGLNLIRLEWGYMLNSPIGTNSTFWEGYLADGSFDYKGTYMSHAHGWATGPTSALTFYVLGIAPVALQGITYSVVPHPGNLTHAEGTLVMATGSVTLSWTTDRSAGTFTEVVNAPSDTYGRLAIPTFGRSVVVDLDGQTIWNSCRLPKPNHPVSTDGRYVYVNRAMGAHVLTSRISNCE